MAVPNAHPPVVEIALADRDATRRLARRLARLARPGDVIGLGGGLGSGKTTLARDFIHTLAGAPCEVPSPTFTLAQTYDVGGVTVWHFDLFRLTRPEDVVELGFEDALAGGITLIEWPERLGDLLPTGRLDITLEQGAAPDSRHARIAASAAWAGRIDALADDHADA